MWNNIRATERFDFVNKSKVEHVVFYPPDSRNASGDIWFYEDLQTQAGDPSGLSDHVSTSHVQECPPSGGGHKTRVTWGTVTWSSLQMWTRFSPKTHSITSATVSWLPPSSPGPSSCPLVTWTWHSGQLSSVNFVNWETLSIVL